MRSEYAIVVLGAYNMTSSPKQFVLMDTIIGLSKPSKVQSSSRGLEARFLTLLVLSQFEHM